MSKQGKGTDSPTERPRKISCFGKAKLRLYELRKGPRVVKEKPPKPEKFTAIAVEKAPETIRKPVFAPAAPSGDDFDVIRDTILEIAFDVSKRRVRKLNPWHVDRLMKTNLFEHLRGVYRRVVVVRAKHCRSPNGNRIAILKRWIDEVQAKARDSDERDAMALQQDVLNYVSRLRADARALGDDVWMEEHLYGWGSEKELLADIEETEAVIDLFLERARGEISAQAQNTPV